VNSPPFLQDVFVDVPGEDGGFVWAHRLALTYDSRNARDPPTSGGFAQVFPRGPRCAGSDASSSANSLEGGFCGRSSRIGWCDGAHGLVEWVDGSELPFFELSALGVRKRCGGFGAGRFWTRDASC